MWLFSIFEVAGSFFCVDEDICFALFSKNQTTSFRFRKEAKEFVTASLLRVWIATRDGRCGTA